MRALILGPWSVRPVRVGHGGKIELDSGQVHGNHLYMPNVKVECGQSSLTDVTMKLGNRSLGVE